MITDKLSNAHLYENINKRIQQAFKYLKETDFSKMTTGKYAIQGDELFAIVNEYETKPAEGSYPEVHKKYIDIQYMVSGCELIGYAPFCDAQIVDDYNEENDIAFFQEETDFFKLEEGMFAIFFPDDLHMPGIIAQKAIDVKKIVMKVRV